MPQPPVTDGFLDEVCHELREHFDIDHITIQLEHGDGKCHQAPAHVVQFHRTRDSSQPRNGREFMNETTQRSVFDVPRMDCPSEERMVRMALEGAKIDRLEFDLAGRCLTVWHSDPVEGIGSRLE